MNPLKIKTKTIVTTKQEVTVLVPGDHIRKALGIPPGTWIDLSLVSSDGPEDHDLVVRYTATEEVINED